MLKSLLVKDFLSYSLRKLPKTQVLVIHTTQAQSNGDGFQKYVELKQPGKKITAWNYYYRQNFPDLKKENPTLTQMDIMKSVALSWKNLNKEEKEVYQKEVDRLMNPQEKLQEFANTLTAEQLEDYKKRYQVLSSEKQRRKSYRLLREEERSLNKPVKPSINGYIIFLKEHYSNLTDKKSVVNAAKEISVKWNQLQEAQKDVYRTRAKIAFEKYLSDLEAWKDKMINEGHHNLIKRGQRNSLRKKLAEKDKEVNKD